MLDSILTPIKNGEKMKNKELLAPAGSYEALVAAVQGGADAVYLSGKSFGARKYAANFNLEEIKEAVAYCHIRNVKVYITVNTLIKDEEMKELIYYIGQLYMADIDAIIVQDLGVLSLVKEHYPDLECHASTQMSLHNTEDVRVAQSMGLKRVVLARELSLKEIQTIIDETGVEVEAFIHGALCISYSGQCLISSMIGGRSGNRGSCAQACRRDYQLVTFEDMRSEKEVLSNGYLLSPKDLSSATGFESLMSSSIYAYKIEGRMKGPEYTFQVVSTYRKLMDEASKNNGVIEPALIQEAQEKLSKVFNREYTSGHILQDPQKNRMSIDTPSNKGYHVGEVTSYDGKKLQLTLRLKEELSVGDDVQIRRGNKTVGGRVEHVFIGSEKEKLGLPGQIVRIPFKHKVFPGETIYKTYDKQLVQEVTQWLDKERLRIPVDMTITMNEGSPITIKVMDGKHHVVEVVGEKLVEKAMNVALSEERIIEQLGKIGDTPYLLGQSTIISSNDVTVPIKEINRVRREALEALTALRAISYPERVAKNISIGDVFDVMDLKKYPVSLTCSVATLEQLDAVIASGVSTIYYKDLKTATEAYDKCLDADVSFSLHGNKMLHDVDLQKVMTWLDNHAQSGVVFGHLGGVRQADKRPCAGDFGLNVMNAYTLKKFEDFGVETIHVSPELTSEEIKGLPPTIIEKEMLLFGRQSVMMMNYCPVKECNVCESVANCKLNQHGLVDEKGAFFPLFGTDCKHVQVLNGPYVNLIDEITRLEHIGISKLRIEFYNEDRSFVNGVLSMVMKALDGNPTYKTDEEWLKTTYDISYTNGHLRRGVE